MQLPLACVLLLTGLSHVSASIRGTPATGSCLCATASSLNIRNSACNHIGSISSGQCYKFTGSTKSCVVSGKSYTFYKISYGNDAWAAGDYMDVSSSTRCPNGGGGGSAPTSGTYYTCDITDAGKRIHETSSRQPSVDCLDTSCGNTCKGGQCVAYVACRCKRNGRQPPTTGCWRPGPKVALPNGKCNRAIPRGTAIATFSSNTYYGHAAVFVGCDDDYTIKVYDQSCQHSVRYSYYRSSTDYYNKFAVITAGPGCSDRTAFSCRVENSGPTTCPSYKRGYSCN